MRVSDEIKIEKNSICFNDEMIRVSQITRTYIIKFFNYRKQQYQDQLKKYNDNKIIYESVESSKKKMRIRNCAVSLLICLGISIYLLQRNDLTSGLGKTALVLLGLAIIFGIAAFMAIRKKIEYLVPPPAEESFPDNHGLFIEMSSGKSVAFTAVDDRGKEALRDLQNQINNADELSKPVTVNMTENHIITVENNEGNISLGDHTSNTIQEKETMKA